MASPDLWNTFVAKLTATGTSLEDIEDCTPQLLQQVFSELGFSALQSAKLQTEWSRRQTVSHTAATATSIANKLGSGGDTAVPGMPGRHHQYRPHGATTSAASTAMSSRNGAGSRIPIGEAMAEFKEVAHHATDFLVTASSLPRQTFTILGVERVVNGYLESTFGDSRAKMNSVFHANNGGTSTNPVGLTTTILWRYVALEEVDRVCQDGFNPSSMADSLCSSGLVFFSSLNGIDSSAVGSAAAIGNSVDLPPIAKLVAVEVALGNVKIVDEEDAALLSHFSNAKCHKSLREDGFDSIQIRRRAPHLPDTYLIFDDAQACPRHVVTFAFSSNSGAGPSGGGIHHGEDSAVDLTNATSGAVSSFQRGFCSVHPTKEYEFWCEDEKKLVCSHCMFVNGYQQKRCTLLEDAVKTERPSVERWADGVSNFVRESGNVMLAFDAAMDGVEREATKEVDAFRDEINQLKVFLDDLVTRHEEEVRARASEQSLVLQKTLTQVVTEVSKAEDVAILAKDALKTSRPLDILIARQVAAQHWDPVRIPAYVHPSIRFDYDQVAKTIAEKCQVVDVAGSVDLPEAIDLNNLSNN